MLQEGFGWRTSSIIGGIMRWRFLFQLHPGPVKGPQVVKFLQALLRHVPGRALVIWDGAAIHRCRVAKECIQTTKGWLEAERSPAHAPELNPAEYMWVSSSSTRSPICV
ncbi:MAG TPA: transposase [Verrucomicrobiota bacterium]|nr:transposase [Verrucomicrobiota bacterium]